MKLHLRPWPALLLVCSGLSGQTARRAVVIDLDGVRRDTFVNAYQEGRLPNFQRVLGDAFWFDEATSVVPPVTMTSQASIFTGTFPSRHGMVGNQWFERDGSRMIDYMNTNGISCVYGFTVLGGATCAAGLGNRHLQAPTIYEAAAAAGLTSVAVYNQYWRGASQPAAPTAVEASMFIKGYTVDFRMFDAKMAARAMAELQSHGMPSILTLYFAGADTAAHKDGIAAQLPYLSSIVDVLLGRILDVIEGLDPQWRSSTMFILTADHGRSDVEPHPEDRTLVADLSAALPAGTHVAVNGGIGYIYLAQPDHAALPSLAAVLESDPKLSAAIASVRPRTADDPVRAGDLVVTLRRGHYFNNPGSGSQHGGVSAEDLAVPLVVAVPGTAGTHVSGPASITQIARTIADYLGFNMESAGPALPVRRRIRMSVGQ